MLGSERCRPRSLDGSSARVLWQRAPAPRARVPRRPQPLLPPPLGPQVFLATQSDEFRKPGAGMWDFFVENCNAGVKPDLASSFYVGDMAGRVGDVQGGGDGAPSDTDKGFAAATGIGFKTPEEAFGEGEAKKELVFQGSAGKNTGLAEAFQVLTDHYRKRKAALVGGQSWGKEGGGCRPPGGRARGGAHGRAMGWSLSVIPCLCPVMSLCKPALQAWGQGPEPHAAAAPPAPLHPIMQLGMASRPPHSPRCKKSSTATPRPSRRRKTSKASPASARVQLPRSVRQGVAQPRLGAPPSSLKCPSRGTLSPPPSPNAATSGSWTQIDEWLQTGKFAVLEEEGEGGAGMPKQDASAKAAAAFLNL